MEFDLTQPITDFSGFTLGNLDELRTAAFKAATEIRDKDKSALTGDDLQTLRNLKTITEAEAEERAKREKAATELLADEAFTDPAKAEVVEETKVETPPAAEVKEPVAVTAAGTKPKAPRVADVAKGTELPEVAETDQEEIFARLVAGPDAGSGATFANWLDVAKVAERHLQQYKGAMGGTARHGIARIAREFPKNLRTIDDKMEAFDLLRDAGNELNLPGGSLTAAAGWCAPSQTVYDLCELETRDGMVDAPEIQISRGGIRFTPGPDFASIWGGSGYFHQTEAQVIAGTTKPCMEIPCPEFEDVRLEVEGLCITGSILQRRGYPELVERFIRGALTAHAHKMNAWKIAAMVADSTAVDMSPPTEIPLDVTTTGLLAGLELQVIDMRYRHRMALNATMEVVLPAWAKGVIRSDLSRRTGVDLINVTDAMIEAFFRTRGARLQWVYDWQDAFSGVAGGPGAATPMLTYANDVSYLIYPAGTFVFGVDDVIRLDTVYDSTKLSVNQYTALFLEEGILLTKPCGESRVVTQQLIPTGASSSTVAFTG